MISGKLGGEVNICLVSGYFIVRLYLLYLGDK